MGFVRGNGKIEECLNHSGAEWRILSDSEYKMVVKKWKESFELLIDNFPKWRGYDALELLTSKLGDEIYIFNVPNYFITTQPLRNKPTYAYIVTSLKSFDRQIFNSEEAIIYSIKLNFMCVFSSEEWVIPELYFEI